MMSEYLKAHSPKTTTGAATFKTMKAFFAFTRFKLQTRPRRMLLPMVGFKKRAIRPCRPSPAHSVDSKTLLVVVIRAE